VEFFSIGITTGDSNMKMQALIIAAALCGGAAFAAAPNDTAKAPADTDAQPGMSKSMAQHHHRMGKHHSMHHHAMHHGMKNRDRDTASSAPSVDLNDQSRQSRMEEALSKYRQQHG
jgi:hypothetical protein